MIVLCFFCLQYQSFLYRADTLDVHAQSRAHDWAFTSKFYPSVPLQGVCHFSEWISPAGLCPWKMPYTSLEKGSVNWLGQRSVWKILLLNPCSIFIEIDNCKLPVKELIPSQIELVECSVLSTRIISTMQVWFSGSAGSSWSFLPMKMCQMHQNCWT